MTTFTITLAIEVDAKTYDEAYLYQGRLRDDIRALPGVIDVVDIDVEDTNSTEEMDE